MSPPKARTRADRSPRIARLALLDLVVLGAAAGLWVWAFRSRAAVAWSAAAGFSIVAAGAAAWFMRKVVKWQASPWVGEYLRRPRYRIRRREVLDVCFQFVDHFEPDHGGADAARQVARVEAWQEAYGRAARGQVDSDGRCPQHTWFFPVHEHDPAVGKVLADWPGRGWGEIEYHTHHDPEMTEDQFRAAIPEHIAALRDLGAVTSGRYAFVHGMFALAGGDPAWCKMAGEIDVLRETGCYADFTFGSIGTPAQPRQVNSIYYARTTGRAKPYDTGDECTVGGQGEGLLILPGPMCFGLFPRALDDAHVEPDHLPHPRRIGRWLEAHVHVRGRPNWVFVSVHSHTAPERAHGALFSGAMQSLWSALSERFGAGGARLHYLTAREAYNVAKAAEAGCEGNPGDYRDYDVPPPAGRAGGR